MSSDEFRYQNRLGRAASWAAQNPVPLEGEISVEKDTDTFKMGDGTTAYNDLPPYQPTPTILGLIFTPFATVNRPDPTTLRPGSTYFDTTLGKPAWSDGTDWVDAAGTAI